MLNWFVLQGFRIILKSISLHCLKDGISKKERFFTKESETGSSER